MRISDFGLLTDQNIDPQVIAFLRQQGFDVLDVKEQGWIDWVDEDLLGIASAAGRLVVTHDSDLGMLAQREGKSRTGIIYLRPGHFSAQVPIECLSALLSAGLECQPPFVVVVRHSGRQISIRLRELH